MTVMSGSQGGVLDFRTFNVSTLFNHNSTSVTEDGATYRINSSNSTQLFGVNLTFNSFDAPTAGLATDLLVVRNGVLSLSMTGIDASAATLFDLAEAGDTAGFLGLLLKGNDTVLGTTSKDVLWGLGGNDLLRGRGGTDTLDGGIGNDTLDGGSGGDRLIGGSGIDIASYRYSGEGLTVSLSSLSLRTGDAKNDSFSSIEGLSGGDHADTLIGNASGNVIDGGLGNDTISGLSGRDTLRGSYGADVLTGGAASDWLAGGAGADKFVFQKISDSAAATSLRDTIADFTTGVGSHQPCGD